MIYFFHHYELPDIIQQHRLQHLTRTHIARSRSARNASRAASDTEAAAAAASAPPTAAQSADSVVNAPETVERAASSLQNIDNTQTSPAAVTNTNIIPNGTDIPQQVLAHTSSILENGIDGLQGAVSDRVFSTADDTAQACSDGADLQEKIVFNSDVNIGDAVNYSKAEASSAQLLPVCDNSDRNGVRSGETCLSDREVAQRLQSDSLASSHTLNDIDGTSVDVSSSVSDSSDTVLADTDNKTKQENGLRFRSTAQSDLNQSNDSSSSLQKSDRIEQPPAS